MKFLTFTLHARQPLLLTSLQGDPNSSVSFDYIPGSVIRGALIGRYRTFKGKDIDPMDDTIQRLFFNAQTRYLHGYPYIRHSMPTRALPSPRSFLREKDTPPDAATIYDFGVFTPPPNDERVFKRTEGFVGFDSSHDIIAIEQSRQVNIHNQRDRMRGRGIESSVDAEGSGALFRYDAIAAGSTFQATIICEDESDADVLMQLLQNARFWLGRSRSAGYGETEVCDVTMHDAWDEVGSSVNNRIDNLEGQELRITLLSDMFVRDANGHPTCEPPLAAIGRTLGINTPTLVHQRSFLATTLHGGFNRTWGLPLPQLPALATGSVLTLKCFEMPKETKLAEFETRGLGDRRAEGFGRVVVEWPPRFATRTYLDNMIDTPPFTGTLSASSSAIAREMARTLLTQRLESSLITLVDRLPISGAITNTQLSRLRIVARRALSDPVEQRMERVKTLLERLTSTSRAQFEQTRIGIDRPQSFFVWLAEHIEDPQKLWNAPEIPIAGQSVKLDDLATYYTLRLIMAVARLRVKENDR